MPGTPHTRLQANPSAEAQGGAGQDLQLTPGEFGKINWLSLNFDETPGSVA